MKKVELVEASVTRLDKDKKYLIVFSNQTITKEDAVSLSNDLEKMGVQHVAVVVPEDPERTVKIIAHD